MNLSRVCTRLVVQVPTVVERIAERCLLYLRPRPQFKHIHRRSLVWPDSAPVSAYSQSTASVIYCKQDTIGYVTLSGHLGFKCGPFGARRTHGRLNTKNFYKKAAVHSNWACACEHRVISLILTCSDACWPRRRPQRQLQWWRLHWRPWLLSTPESSLYRYITYIVLHSTRKMPTATTVWVKKITTHPKCPSSAETHAFRRLWKSLIALLIVVCCKSSQICCFYNVNKHVVYNTTSTVTSFAQ